MKKETKHAIAKLVKLDQRKPEIEAYYSEREAVLKELAELLGVGGGFEEDGAVFQIVKPTGRWVVFSEFEYRRTLREGETGKAGLSKKFAEQFRANGFQPMEGE